MRRSHKTPVLHAGLEKTPRAAPHRALISSLPELSSDSNPRSTPRTRKHAPNAVDLPSGLSQNLNINGSR